MIITKIKIIKPYIILSSNYIKANLEVNIIKAAEG